MADGDRTRLEELERPKDDPAPKALACSGVLVRRRPQDADQLVRRCGEGRPVRSGTIAFLAWGRARLGQQGVTAWLLIGDTAAWHKRQVVRDWIRSHTRPVQQTGQVVRMVACLLPSQRPWLNPIAPTWVHGKRAVSDPDRMLSADEREGRVCASYGCPREPHLVMPEKVA